MKELLEKVNESFAAFIEDANLRKASLEASKQ